jgi:acetyl-CoA acetyltransferase
VPEAVIVDCLRTAVGKAPRGALRNSRPDDLAAAVIARLLEKYPQVDRRRIDDVILGCAMPEAEAGSNMARLALLRAGLPDEVTGVTINRFCSSGLQAIAMAADRIRAGGAEIIIAGGAESMSLMPSCRRFRPGSFSRFSLLRQRPFQMSSTAHWPKSRMFWLVTMKRCRSWRASMSRRQGWRRPNGRSKPREIWFDA